MSKIIKIEHCDVLKEFFVKKAAEFGGLAPKRWKIGPCCQVAVCWLSRNLRVLQTSPFSPAERGGRWRPLWRNSRFFSPPFSFLFWFCFPFDYFHCVDRVKICRFHHFLADFKAVFGHFGPLKFHSSSVGFVKGIQDGRHGVVAAQSKSGALRQASARALSQ